MKNKEKDYVMQTIGFQTAVSLIIIGIVFAISKTSAPLFKKLSDELVPILSASLTREDAEDAFKHIKVILFTDDERSKGSLDGSAIPEHSENQDDNSGTDTKPETVKENEITNKNETTTLNNEGLIATVLPESKTKQVSLNLNKNGKEVTATASNSPYSLNGTIYSPLSGKITSKFGERIHPVYNTKDFHTGLDIAGKKGEYIRSIADGKVIRADYDKWNGNYLEIDHGNGITTMYCHCRELLAPKDTKVRGGEAIAKVGSTGVSTGNHLHFEFRINGVSYNPLFALNCAADAV